MQFLHNKTILASIYQLYIITATQEAFEALNAETTKQESGFEKANRLFYLALPPSVFAPVTSNIKLCCMSSR